MRIAVVAEGRETQSTERLKITIHGAVQGVGFRPFVYRLATKLGLRGGVLNSSRGVFIEVEGERPELERFLLRLEQEKPPMAIIRSLEFSFLDPAGYTDFDILHSEETGEKTALILPDIATCPECRREVLDTGDRRYRYPFTNCTHCGPRFTIIRALPYDRPNTSMAQFPLCPDCRREYESPLDRRFHAQPVACPVCGPQVTLWNERRDINLCTGKMPVSLCTQGNERMALNGDEAVREAARAVREGRILAMKGLGGFLLIIDARSEAVVQRLRERKHREEKPFALLYPLLEEVKKDCFVSPLEERILTSPESPIVLLRRRPEASVAPSVATASPYLGVMLPYTPLHGLLMQELGFPVVATSGNRSDELICIDENDAREQLGDIADLFLIHNRPIVRHCDDSIVRVVLGQELVLRRARGYAPLPVLLKAKATPDILNSLGQTGTSETGFLEETRFLPTIAPEIPRRYPPPAGSARPILAVGAHLKNTIALSVGQQVFLSQHIGDLNTPEACTAFERVIADFLRLYEVEPVAVAHDLHPDYFSTQWARKLADLSLVEKPGFLKKPGFCARESVEKPGFCVREVSAAASLSLRAKLRNPEEAAANSVKLIPVQHHHAHLAACLAENEVEGPVLGVIWDGTGYGPDGTVWGGEFLWGDASGFVRVAHLRPFRLPGGEAAVREPRRAALGILWEHFGQEALEREDLPARLARPTVAAFSCDERRLLRQMLEQGVNCPVTTSAGRLFDAVVSLVGLRQQAAFEGQAAMMLEYAVDETVTDAYPLLISDGSMTNEGIVHRFGHYSTEEPWFLESCNGRNDEHRPNDQSSIPGEPSRPGGPSRSGGPTGIRVRDREPRSLNGGIQERGCQQVEASNRGAMILDWGPLLEALLADLGQGLPVRIIAARFHNALVEGIVAVAKSMGVERIALSGGCFQNRILLERASCRLSEAGLRTYVHQRIPPNDGGIALGQVAVAMGVVNS